MKYRLEYDFVGADTAGNGKKEFDAKTDKDAVSSVKDVCEQEASRLNEGIENKFYHFSVNPRRLVRIDQSEISTEIAIRP